MRRCVLLAVSSSVCEEARVLTRWASPLSLSLNSAGEVTYQGEGFLEKNRDTLTEDIVLLLQTSKHPFLNTLYPPGSTNLVADRKSSLSKQFNRQLTTLMLHLNRTEPHYIRCVKPNAEKAALKFVPRNCFEQLTYSGVFEAVAIRKLQTAPLAPHTFTILNLENIQHKCGIFAQTENEATLK